MRPIFPILMVFSFTYIFILSGYLLLKYNTKKLMVFHFCLGIMFLLLGTMIFHSATVGGKYFFSLFMITCMLKLVISFVLFSKLQKGNVTNEGVHEKGRFENCDMQYASK
jgi:predicted membrane protein